jgi:hypothetical protein
MRSTGPGNSRLWRRRRRLSLVRRDCTHTAGPGHGAGHSEWVAECADVRGDRLDLAGELGARGACALVGDEEGADAFGRRWRERLPDVVSLRQAASGHE